MRTGMRHPCTPITRKMDVHRAAAERTRDRGGCIVDVLKSCRVRRFPEPCTSEATPELRPLQLVDDGLVALDFAGPALDDNGHLAHQTVQQRRIGRQIFKIEPHIQFYSNLLIRRSEFAIFYAGFCVV
jgi:hypothetical protein